MTEQHSWRRTLFCERRSRATRGLSRQLCVFGVRIMAAHSIEDAKGQLRFSLSHATALSAARSILLLTSGSIWKSRDTRPPCPLPTAISPIRRGTGCPLSRSEARHHQFYALWTVKEAYAKGLGLGLNLPLNTFCIELSPGGEAQFGRLPSILPEAETWSLRSWRQGGHWAGLAVKAAVRDLVICKATI